MPWRNLGETQKTVLFRAYDYATHLLIKWCLELCEGRIFTVNRDGKFLFIFLALTVGNFGIIGIN